MEPLVFEPFLRPQPWGGTRLRHFGKKLDVHGLPIGESWELSGHPVHISQVASGPLSGMSLAELWERWRIDLAGPCYVGPERFPLLIKLLDCEEPLSVQVHPSDRYALSMGLPDPGKCEAWVVLESSPSARLDAGLREGVDSAELQQSLVDGTVDRCLNQLRPETGDCLFLPSGTVHSARGGVVLVEVQPTSDVTFRLFDWDRRDRRGQPRALHREQGLQSVDWALGPLDFVRSATTLPLAKGASLTLLLSTSKFELHRYDLSRAYTPRELVHRMSFWVVTAGSVELRTSTGGKWNFGPGGSVLVPAAASAIEWNPESEHASLIAVTLGPEFESRE